MKIQHFSKFTIYHLYNLNFIPKYSANAQKCLFPNTSPIILCYCDWGVVNNSKWTVFKQTIQINFHWAHVYSNFNKNLNLVVWNNVHEKKCNNVLPYWDWVSEFEMIFYAQINRMMEQLETLLEVFNFCFHAI